mmetsp:Transcript_4016/g.8079  ORF Transcript_4016/g.8079 Transcript_4016/m.8079 type:complete len:288 (+) Transcript_4016:152-1015(+)
MKSTTITMLLVPFMPPLFTLSLNLQTVIKNVPPLKPYQSPNPTQQMLMYLHHVGGKGDALSSVFVRKRDDGTEGDDVGCWEKVGFITACTDDYDDEMWSPETAELSATKAATQLTRSAMRQRRLIVEHACVVDPEFRKFKRSVDVGLGLQLEEGNLVCKVPFEEFDDDDFEDDGKDMFNFGFVGSGNLKLYKDFRARWGSDDGGDVLEPVYNGEQVLEWVLSKIESSKNDKSAAVVLTNSMAKGEEVGKEISLDAQVHVMDEKHHAEIVKMTRKVSDAYVYKDGVLI